MGLITQGLGSQVNTDLLSTHWMLRGGGGSGSLSLLVWLDSHLDSQSLFAAPDPDSHRGLVVAGGE